MCIIFRLTGQLNRLEAKMVASKQDTTDSVQRILDSAGRCFGQNGYDGSSMNKIARDASVEGALALPFQVQGQLYMRVVLRTCTDFLNRQADHRFGQQLSRTLEVVLT